MSAELRKSKTIEQIYQKKSQLEHILLRPDTYVGSIETQRERLWVWDDAAQKIVQKEINFVPGLYKIFDEILVNAADNFQRDPEHMTYIKVNINEQEGWVSVENNGATLPVEMHKEHQMYVPEMVFGHLLTSDNYNDDESKVTGGRNGYGAKLTNIFSTKFTIECGDSARGQKYIQTWENNMGVKNKAKMTKFSGKDFTKVTFHPDLKRFGMSVLDQDIVSLMKKRVMDASGSTNKKCRVWLNGNPIGVKDFKDYVDLYLDREDQPKVYDKFGDRWEYVVTTSEGQFQQVSFVNSINTIKGGTHVLHVADQFVEALLDKVNKKNKGGMEVKPFHVRSHLWIFVNCLIVNPTFDSQTKETMTLKQSKFGSKCEVQDRAIKQLVNTGIIDTILQWAKAKESIDMKRKMKASGRSTRVMDVPKLEDANLAGGKGSEECTLILTEGDSAKALAVAGLSIVGRDRFGVFPLRGKPLNVREASFQQTVNNAEIQNIIKIMGLEQQKQYDSVKSLRYGSIMIMADQDYDGSHIKGLLINMIQHWWPSLFKMEGFLKEFITPIVKVSKGQQEIQFFTLADYEAWKDKNNNGKGWTTKYYKGLGTSTAKEGKDYFKNIKDHRMEFRWTGQKDDELIDLAFNKKRADDRKNWINSYVEGVHVDHSKANLSYYDFVNKELVQFAKYDTQRSVPSVVDGFKPSQRKVLFCAFKKKLKNDIKVAQFVGYISEQSAYHHGEVSLENTIINLAQNYVGSNNVNLLVPSGQFGTRLQGGKDHAASRYIYTRLSNVTRTLFHTDDDKVLKYLNEEGQSIEPVWYCPILPTVLVNGADGIGTGWSTSVPNYNPRDIIHNIQKYLRGEAFSDMHPWYKGFRGTITPNEKEDGRYDIVGCIQKKNDTTLIITELPVKVWTQSYKEFLEEMMPEEGKKPEDSNHTITDYKEYHTENTVHFEVTLSAEKMKELEKSGLEKAFKMRSSISTSNMVLFDEEGKIAKYNTALDILKDFCKLRRQVYVKRKAYLVAKLTREKEILSNKARFILMVVKGELELRKRKKADILKDLQKRGFKTMTELDAILTEGGATGEAEKADIEAAKEAAADPEAEKSDYDYLLGMNLWSLTFEKVEELKQQHEQKREELEILRKTTIETMWDRDLEELKKALDDIDKLEEEEAEAAANFAAGRKKKDANRQAAAAPKRKPTPKPEDKAMLKRPLQEVVSIDDAGVEKQTWGTGAPMARSVAEPAALLRGEEPVGALAAPPKKRGRAGGTPGALSGGATAPVPEPVKEEGGASLLSRLLSKTSPTKSSGGSSLGGNPLDFGNSFSSFSSLSGSDDIFGYLHTGAPSSATDRGDDNPFISLDSEASPVAVEDEGRDTAEEGAGAGRGHGKGRGRGRGRGKASDGDAADEGRAAKRRKGTE
eukprot:TRINITY_DN5779_c0_g2_i5.p1 TRINITY_DN5779_c0_g2~~TRINITY_DN5779_c0_g2_i5.p1  ORF type:complete len:1403 (-),score=411.44 TRINITY_DN5779_c0_g2_i5:164-4372(-)